MKNFLLIVFIFVFSDVNVSNNSVSKLQSEKENIQQQLLKSNQQLEELKITLITKEEAEKQQQTLHEEKLASLQSLQDSLSDSQNTINSLNNQIQQLHLQRDTAISSVASQQSREFVDTPTPVKEVPVSKETPTETDGPVTDKNFLHFKQVEALHESEKKRFQQKIEELQKLLSDSENLNREHLLQVEGLREEIRDIERSQHRGSANMDYLKNVIVKYMETDDLDVSSIHN